jgi:hypothetical protein
VTLLLLLVACRHTPPHEPIAGTVVIELDARAALLRNGEECQWEAEQLRIDGAPVWAVEPPEGEDWCLAGDERARTVDIVSQDGPFLSTILGEMDASGAWTRRCVTWDLRTRAPATLLDWDERRAPRRLAELATAKLRDPSLAGWTLSPEAFLVRDGHVAFCAMRGTEIREVVVK